ncbi:MBL fold metallo-hydrolase [Cellulomonas algicola]|uniref:MBL fold metallo-hydrolase n=1 Tax=Cellulomonas algicola TaxID=2071633 RepID=A0A401V3M6_9CELL|nr:MBL fold metallo-hydrolase [Cellulomonas algicola]GCD21529.1 MBL fold metallo-hydrolase [Cellulomonas algicola]
MTTSTPGDRHDPADTVTSAPGTSTGADHAPGRPTGDLMGRVRATFVGGPTLLLHYAGLAFLTDPTFDAAPAEYPGAVTLHKLVGPAATPADLGPVDAVLLSHDQHADNLDVSGRALLADVPLVLSTPDAAARVPGVRGLAPWEETRVGDRVRVTAVPAVHGPPGAEALSGQVTGFVLRAAGEPTVYVSGDNAQVDVVAQVAERFPDVAVAVLFVGGANVGRFGAEPLTLDAGRAVAATALLAGARVVPVHHTDWAHFVDPLDAFVEAARAADLEDRLVVLERGVPTTV